MHHRSTLSTPILTRIIHDLICHGFFDHHSPRTHLDLELHLRTIVAALRLLSAHGIEAGKGTLTFAYFDELYNRMARWQTYHLRQVERAKGAEETSKNYNNEFLIAYVRDLISSVPSDRTVATNVAQRMIAAVSVLGHAVFLLLVRVIVVWKEHCTGGAVSQDDCPVQASSVALARPFPNNGRSLYSIARIPTPQPVQSS